MALSSLARRGAAVLGLALLMLAGSSPICSAQGPVRDEGCVLDNCADKAPSAAERDAAAPASQSGFRSGRPSGGVPGEFDFYVLALSWSSGFCRTPAAARAHGQCDPGANLGFVVHGLWPQYERGYPSDCEPGAQTPSRIALESAAGLYPDEGLARHEWRKHGVCSGKSPTDYFADVRRARDAIAIPPSFQSAKQDQTWTPLDVERAFIAANRRLRPGMIGVACAGGVLQEVRICFSKDLRDFHACPEVSRQGCRAREISVPGIL
ncbi:ribonuclease T2 family protein [Methylocapsa acidiphila]|uniref:ribonuclease T2 family protein n=1 Tax=Methylocapsa acidiphila TaxID=133552 RepID=UPI0004050EC7|nr:ribonuclease T2 [Methylocapsa acidiphila]